MSTVAVGIRRRLGIFGVGITANWTLSYVCDYLLYPFIIWHFGLLRGGLLNTALSLVSCLALLRFYDWSKTDWLGIETVKDIKTYTGSKELGLFASWLIQKGEPAIFIFLSLKFDPFITTAYMRHGSHQYNGMSRRDWQIFIGSLLFSNVY